MALSRACSRAIAISRGSGGAGRHKGGDGTIRRMRFLEPMSAALLSEPSPGGALRPGQGGSPGALGRHWVERADGRIEEFPGCARTEVAAGDVFVIQTPAGGGFGAPSS